MARSPRKRKLITLLLATPAIATAALWIASHFWSAWYCSLPPGTTHAPNTAFPPSTRVRILAGAIHYTDDATFFAALNANRSPAAGTMYLGTMYNRGSDTAESGVNIHWSPYGINATHWSWSPEYFPGNWNLPLYLPFALFLLPAATYWLLTRPRKPGVCTNCGYSRTGLPHSAPCPECGGNRWRPSLPKT
jgi:hypothetical protein